MKKWFFEYKEYFHLGLSLDGTRETHNHNRSNSFDKIDIEFFKNTWPAQSVKMTLSEYSLLNLADNIKYIHSWGFQMEGVNLFEGDFDWSDEKYIKILVPQLKDLVKFYVENPLLHLNPMFDKRLDFCEVKDKSRKKWCEVGTGISFFDVDGKMYPCSFMTPMTFSLDELANILKTDFMNDNNFIDEYCFKNCYIYPICDTCAGTNYIVNKNFKQRDKRKCRVNELITLFIADLQSKRILKNPSRFDKPTLYHTIISVQNRNSFYHTNSC
jgi:radical SAM protein with 4Fe4S-binding SPASM domain